jgi:ATP-binding cassette subfamily B protein
MSASVAPTTPRPPAARPDPWWRRLLPRRVPVVMQATDYECAAASLAMILGYHGRKTRVDECTESYGATRDGVTAAAIVRDARRFGLVVKQYSVTVEKLPTLRLPAIVYWNFNHFIVVERLTSKGVHVVDPAWGRRRVSHEEFDRSFTGITLTFERGLHFSRGPGGRTRGTRELAAALMGVKGFWRLVGQILLLSALVQVAGLAYPLFMKLLIDHFVPARVINAMSILLLGLVSLIGARWVMTLLRGRATLILKNRVDWILLHGVFEHLLSLPLRFFQQRSVGDVLTRLSGATHIREVLTSRSVGAVLDTLFVAGYLAILYSQSPVFAAVALGLGLVESLFVLLTSKYITYFVQESLVAEAQCEQVLIESVTGIETVKATGTEAAALQRWSGTFAKMLNNNLRQANAAMLLDTVMTIIQWIAPLLVTWLAARRVLGGTMTIGTMLAMQTLVACVIEPLSSLAATLRDLQVAGVHFRRLWDIVEARAEQEGLEVIPTPPLTGAVELRDVSFRYGATSPHVLRNVSVTITPGQKVALVGRTGSGKSTLASLLLGLHTPTEGEVLFDGIPISRLERSSLRSQFGSVMQEPFLFSGSIRDNIAAGDRAMPLADIQAAARQAVIHEDIEQMAMMYETLLSGGGRSLSGGQKQRIALARALARRPRILLLDEATSHLDVITEAQIDRNLEGLSCTRIAIAHRLSTVRNADLILVLADGQIAERGNHQELVAQGGLYARLIHEQSQAQGIDPAWMVTAHRRPAAAALTAKEPS